MPQSAVPISTCNAGTTCGQNSTHLPAAAYRHVQCRNRRCQSARAMLEQRVAKTVPTCQRLLIGTCNAAIGGANQHVQCWNNVWPKQYQLTKLGYLHTAHFDCKIQARRALS
ncbi:unnamed protein product [Polarella glacialis]|uniref:Uncharacterized protein n=1 Tax=Polarella glacialis TaxID=89957 RepID=A0A813KYS5_POLGL|nr:unnamed protein product [Polarella glacialis]CAE8715918.1 unnamed protein product [Polarella glacialis]